MFSPASACELLGQDFCRTRCCGWISPIDFSVLVGSETLQVHPEAEKVKSLYLCVVVFFKWFLFIFASTVYVLCKIPIIPIFHYPRFKTLPDILTSLIFGTTLLLFQTRKHTQLLRRRDETNIVLAPFPAR